MRKVGKLEGVVGIELEATIVTEIHVLIPRVSLET